MGLTPGDHRSDSYKKRADSRSALRSREDAARKKELEESALEIRSEDLIRSDLSGVNQVAIRGDASTNTKLTQKQERVESLPGVNSPGYNPFTGQVLGRVSGGVAQKLAASGERPQSIRGDVPYLMSVDKSPRRVVGFYSKLRGGNGGSVSSGASSGDMFSDGPGFSSRASAPKEESRLGLFFKGAGDAIISPVRGSGKVLPYYFSTQAMGVRDYFLPPSVKQQRSLSRYKGVVELQKDNDVTNFNIALGSVYAGGASPLVGRVLGGIVFGVGSAGLVSSWKARDYRGLGSNAALVGLSSAGAFELAQGGYVRLGSKYVPPEGVFAESVLSGREKLPLAKNINDAFFKFKNAKINGELVVQTSSPAKISGGVAGVGKKAALGLEDPGIYVTPKGYGSPAFLRISNGDSGYSFNPLPRFGIPTVTRFAVRDVVRYPRDVVRVPGFEAVSTYQSDVLAGKGVAVITKRSELGQGALKSQFFENVKQGGKRMIEPGTTELEAVIPVSQSFKYNPKTFFGRIKGFDYYTKYDGRVVAIRDAALLSERGRGKVLRASKVKMEQDYLSRYDPSSRSGYVLSGVSSIVAGSSKAYSSRLRRSYSKAGLSSKAYAASSRSVASGFKRSFFASSVVGRSVNRSKGYSRPSGSVVYGGSSVSGSRVSGSSIAKIVGSSYVTSIDKPKAKIKFKVNRDLVKIGDVPAARVTKYVPSFTALYFNIRGKKVKASKSGLDFRPITKNFRIAGYNVNRARMAL